MRPVTFSAVLPASGLNTAPTRVNVELGYPKRQSNPSGWQFWNGNVNRVLRLCSLAVLGGWSGETQEASPV
jgi:hypothetical protein